MKLQLLIHRMNRQCWAIAGFASTLTFLWCQKCILQIAKWLTTTPTSQPKSVQHLNSTRLNSTRLDFDHNYGCRVFFFWDEQLVPGSDCIEIRRELRTTAHPKCNKVRAKFATKRCTLHLLASSPVSHLAAACNTATLQQPASVHTVVVLIMHWHGMNMFFSPLFFIFERGANNLHGIPNDLVSLYN